MFHVKHPPSPSETSILISSDRAAYLAAFPTVPEVEDRLARYEALLRARNETLALISDSTVETIWTRHFLDSAQLAKLIPRPGDSVVDIGTGAGFPGLVLAIIGLPDVHLVENNMQKVAFLRSVVADLSLPVTVHAMKAEAVRGLIAATVVARALKPLSQLLALSGNLRDDGTTCLFPKGRRVDDELQDAARDWRMDVERFPSLTSAESTILRLRHVARIQA
jgi:16S rRNA (guanine527-N7)-methyltransferase